MTTRDALYMLENLHEVGNPFAKQFFRMDQITVEPPPDVVQLMEQYSGGSTNTLQPMEQEISTLFQNWINTCAVQHSTGVDTAMLMATPKQCHARDIFFGEWFHPYVWTKVFGYCDVRIGDVISNVFRYEYELVDSVRTFKEDLYLLHYRNDTRTIHICYEEDAADTDVLFSLIHATRVAHAVRQLELWG
uniref:Spectrin beta chain, erythrocyte n=1 Tax=Lygus hesperus TaxID=30085 RepID=A0A0A9WZP3_LYGHE